MNVAENGMDFISRDEWNHMTNDERIAVVDAVKKDSEYITSKQYQSVNVPNTFYTKYGKRIIDIILSSFALFLVLPINILIAIITYFDVGKPIFFRQERVGKDNKIFYLVKFRNMTNETNELGILLPPEQRITKWGSFVRKTSLDEFLNFWSIFKGDMSLIGPRPLPKTYMGRFSPYHQQRHLVRPGLECPYHDYELAKKGWQGRLDNDIWYVENISFKTDILMSFKLIMKVFSKQERNESASGKTGEFIGYYPEGNVMDEFGIPRKYLHRI